MLYYITLHYIIPSATIFAAGSSAIARQQQHQRSRRGTSAPSEAYTVMQYFIIYYTILYYTIPYHTIPYHTIPYYTILYYIILKHNII